jgi:hypothetical protein
LRLACSAAVEALLLHLLLLLLLLVLLHGMLPVP